MARHSASVSMPPFPLTNVPIEIAVHQDGEHVGFLIISRGSVDWKDRRRRTTGGASWTDLREFLRKRSTRRVRARVATSSRSRARGQAARGRA
jgi:hypothetical protein